MFLIPRVWLYFKTVAFLGSTQDLGVWGKRLQLLGLTFNFCLPKTMWLMKFLLSSLVSSYYLWQGFVFSFTFFSPLSFLWSLVFHMPGLGINQWLEGELSADYFLFTIVVRSFQDFCFSSLIQFGSFQLLPLSFSPVRLLLCLGSALHAVNWQMSSRRRLGECGAHCMCFHFLKGYRCSNPAWVGFSPVLSNCCSNMFCLAFICLCFGDRICLKQVTSW